MSAVQDDLDLSDRTSSARALPGLAALGRRAAKVAPGLALAGGVAAAAYGLRASPVAPPVSPVILAIVIGMAAGNLFGVPAWARPGLAFAGRTLMRAAIVLLGLQLTVGQAAEVGAGGLAAIVATLVATFLFTSWAGRRLGVAPGLTQLIAAGTSICGASAVAAANAVTRAPEEDVAYAVACVTAFGSIAMFAYPMLAGPLGLDAQAYGVWTGASIHEVAQVVAAAFTHGPEAGESGVVAKLVRVMMLAPVVAALSFAALRRAGGGDAARAPFPLFVLGFVAMVALNSVASIPADVTAAAGIAATATLTVSLAAMGMGADVSKLRSKGWRPLALGLAASLFVAGFSLALVKLFV
ncbi:YeiH family protein [Chenggangzhangella methanolivorans]|uniref:YeiH family protein n=1 Tax=Chenggangzhangella methanolivorans TaxID=1437009 RepID=UPI00360E68B4